MCSRHALRPVASKPHWHVYVALLGLLPSVDLRQQVELTRPFTIVREEAEARVRR